MSEETTTNEEIPTKTIAEAKKVKITSVEINGEDAPTVKASLGRLPREWHKQNGASMRTVLLDLNEFNWATALSENALNSSKLEVVLTIEPVPGGE